MYHAANSETLGIPSMVFKAVKDIPKGGDVFDRYYSPGDRDVVGAMDIWGFATPAAKDTGFVTLDSASSMREVATISIFS